MTKGFILTGLLHKNAKWAQDVEEREPGFFSESAQGQAPKVLWYGCADSRVPESVVTASWPGDIFVHRNIANQFHVEDDSAVAVLTYAVEHLGVEHVLIVGHSNCGGVGACAKAAAQPPSEQPPASSLERWLAPLTTLARSVEGGLDALVEANVRVQVENLVRSDIVQRAWAAGKEVQIHGWVYDLATGKLNDLGISVGKDGSV